MNAPATVQPDSFLTLHYRIVLEDGTEAVSTYELSPATLQMGAGQLNPALEALLIGLSAGETRRFELAPERAFGPRNPKLVERIARAALPPELELRENTLVEFGAPNGAGFAGFCRELDATHALIDFNHPLAGKAITFEVQLIGVL